MTTAIVTPLSQGRQVYLRSVDTECIPSISYRLNGGSPIQTGKSTVTLTLSSADALEYWAADLSGNVEAHKTIGTSAPSVTLSVSPSVLTYPAIVTLVADVSDVETTTARFEVRFESDPAWYPVASVTSTTGRFVALHIPPKRAYYRVTVGSTEATAIGSVLVRAGLGRPKATSTRVRAGSTGRFWGAVSPKHPAGDPAADTTYRVRLWKYNPLKKTWTERSPVAWRIEKVLDNETSQWSYTRKFSTSDVGLWRIAFLHVCPRHAVASSPPLQFSVVR